MSNLTQHQRRGAYIVIAVVAVPIVVALTIVMTLAFALTSLTHDIPPEVLNGFWSGWLVINLCTYAMAYLFADWMR